MFSILFVPDIQGFLVLCIHLFFYVFNYSSSMKFGWTLLVKYGQCVYEIIVEYVSKYRVEVIIKMNSQIASCLLFFLCFFGFFQFYSINTLML